MTYIFESGLAHHIEGLIQQKRADGYAYNCEEKLLKRFDAFCVQNYPELSPMKWRPNGLKPGLAKETPIITAVCRW